MAVYQVRGPDGHIHQFNGPEGATPEQVLSVAQAMFSAGVPQPEAPKPAAPVRQPIKDPWQAAKDSVKQSLTDLGAGAIRGAGSIGATIVAPGDMLADALLGDRKQNVRGLVTGEQPLSRNEERRKNIDEGLQSLFGANPDSGLYQTGKIGAEIAGTSGVGPALAAGLLKAAPAASPLAARLAESLASGGFRAGGATGVPGMATRVAGGAVTGGASAGLVDPEYAETGAAVGGALPGATKLVGEGSKLAGKVARSVVGEVSPEVRALAERAKQLGIDIPADRLTNSKPLNATASSLNYVPLSGRAAVEKRMNSQFERAVSRTIGQDSDNLSLALNKARVELGGKFDDTLRNNKVVLDPQFASELDDALAVADRTLSDDGLRIITKQVDAIKQKAATGEIDGQAAYNIKKELDRIAKSNSGQAGHAAIDLKKSLMAALNRSLGPDKAAEFEKVRRQYGNMLDLEGVALRNSEEGGLSVAKLSNQELNNPDLAEIARIARQFIREREGQHGAAQRVFLGAGGGIASAAGLLGVPALGAAPIALGSAAAGGRLVNSLLNSGAVKNYVLKDPNASRQAIVDALLGGAAFRAAPVIQSSRSSP